MMQTPELPPFEYGPQPYGGASAEEVLRSRRQFLNPGLFLYYKRKFSINTRNSGR
jgi:alanine-glyoxylate transaminase / (R)-3-amino-2-methylpropionate-pyruvate transaminase